jgi:type IV pilus assembly protein PilM
MAKITAVWAIDIGQAALKALKLVPSAVPDQVIAEAFDFIEYPKILSQPDADPEELVREALQTFLGRNEVKGVRVAVSVPGQAGLVKFIKLPPVEKKRIPDIVKFEAKQQIPFALEEVIWDYQQIGNEDEEEGGDDDFTMAEVGLFAMKRDQIYRALQPLRAAGIEVDVVQMSPIALYNFAAYEQMATHDGASEGDSIVLLDIGADNTDLIITDGVRIWQRNVPIGGNHFTRALSKEMKQTFAKAEHLKRNATKSADPRAVFTAMRGVFNDFSSEIGRSIGFYSSVNRSAKIARIIGLGNGFKLPGLQNFLKQSLNYDVQRLEKFDHLAGDEVAASPQFIENLMSYAVPYGLGVQGLEISKLKTNLLPPEIEQVRVIRRKKPWALAASVLMMLGFSALFMGDWNALAKVENPAMKSAVEQAKQVATQGDSLKSAFDGAKSAFEAKKTEGENLVAITPETESWPAFLTVVNSTLPNPEAELGLDPNLPSNLEVLRDLRVHIDAIIPRFRADVSTWFTDPAFVRPWTKSFMHPYDRDNPPTGEGWVVQIIGHHYNPSPLGPKAKRLTENEKKVALGPQQYLVQKVVPRFWTPRLRQFGIHHAMLTYISPPDDEWVSSKAAGAPIPVVPVLPKEAAPAGELGGMMGSEGMMSSSAMGSGYSSMSSGMMGPVGGKGSGMMEGGMPMMDQSAYAQMMSGMMGSGRMGPGAAANTPKIEQTYLTRTNFVITLIWQPPAPDAAPETLEEIAAKLKEAAKGQGAMKALSEEEIQKESAAMFKTALDAQAKAMANAAARAGAAAKAATPPAAAPGAAPAPAAAPKAP